LYTYEGVYGPHKLPIKSGPLLLLCPPPPFWAEEPEVQVWDLIFGLNIKQEILGKKKDTTKRRVPSNP
jgi:hypothetical protein